MIKKIIAALCLLFWSQTAYAWSLTDMGCTAGGVTTVIVSGTTVPVGALIVAGTTDTSNASSGGSMTDNRGNSYTSIIAAAANGSGANGFGQVFFFNNNSTTVATIQYTTQTAGQKGTVCALYATGQLVSGPSDSAVTKAATGSSTTPSVTSGTPGASGELLVGWVAAPPGLFGTFTEDSGNGWTATGGLANVNNSGGSGGGGNQTASVSKTFAPTFTTLRAWADFVVGFKAAAAAAAQHGKLPLLGVGN